MKDDDVIFVVQDGPEPTPLEPVPWWAANQAIADAIATFPKEFGLRAFPGERFQISAAASFVSEGTIWLYTVIREPDGHWAAFAKGTIEELRREVTP